MENLYTLKYRWKYSHKDPLFCGNLGHVPILYNTLLELRNQNKEHLQVITSHDHTKSMVLNIFKCPLRIACFKAIKIIFISSTQNDKKPNCCTEFQFS